MNNLVATDGGDDYGDDDGGGATHEALRSDGDGRHQSSLDAERATKYIE